MSSFARPQNFFAVDKPASQIPQVIDINNPNVPRYGSPQNPKLAYPKIVYHHESGRVLQVKNGPQFEAATRRGFVSQPSPDRDYHNVQSGQIAPIKAVGPEREHVMTAEELEQLEAQELASIGQGEAQSAEDADTEIAAQLGEAPEKPGKRKK